MHTVAPSLFWCIDLWNYVDARRCSVMLSKGRAGRGSLVLAATAVRGRFPVYALGAAGLWNHVLLRTSESLNAILLRNTVHGPNMPATPDTQVLLKTTSSPRIHTGLTTLNATYSSRLFTLHSCH
jgi:hypothetical protein